MGPIQIIDGRNRYRACQKILDVAAAAEIYARRQKLGEEAVQYATSIKVEALRQLGNMLKENPKNSGARGYGKSGVTNQYPTLDDMGLDKKTSKLAQDIARLSDEEIAYCFSACSE